jgi:hypothetical protein
MKLKTARNATSTAYEYFLYGILVLETAIAVFAFKTIAQISQLSVASTGYLLLLYAGVLGWVFLQLNRLHSKRKVNPADPSPGVALPDPENPVPPAVQAKSRLPLGLTGVQLAIVFVVFVAAVKLFTWALATLVKP